MLNGKFFTGLPPKMLERSAGAQNRLESHLFWPDDSQTETAHDVRVKRRSSFLSQQPTLRNDRQQRQTSWSHNDGGGDSRGNGRYSDNEVDTKKRFHKEFANSSIQFYDNIQEEEMDNAGRQAIRKPLIRRQLKQDVAIKPTAMNMKLPNNDSAQDEYAAIKKSQAFSSKIQFYDYADDMERQKNNKLKPKMDMNDKKDVERNTKNSPKLQVKGNVRNLRLLDHEQRKNEKNQNDAQLMSERNYDNYEEEIVPSRQEETRILRNEIRTDQRDSNDRYHFERDRNTRYESPVRSYRSSQCDHEDYNDDIYDIEQQQQQQQYNEQRAKPRTQNMPKRILKNSVRDEGDLEYDRDSYKDVEYVERGARNMRIRTSPKKHVTYDDEAYEYERHNGIIHPNERNRNNNRQFDEGTEYGRATRAATYKGNNQYQHQHRQHNRQNIPDYEENIITNDEEHYSNDRMTATGSNATKKSLNFNKQLSGNSKNPTKLNNLSQQQKKQQQQQQQQQITPKLSTSSMAAKPANNDDSATSPLSPTMDSQKHLRSSLCFSGGEIVANNCTETGLSTPTSTSTSTSTEPGSRRTARSAATTRRICVGLPD